MAYRQPPSARQRILSLAMGIGINAAVVLMLVAFRNAPSPVPRSGAMTLISLSAPAATPRASPPPVIPSTLVKELQPPPLSLAELQDLASAGAVGDSCPTLETITKAIIESPAATDAMVHAPPETRSVADAIAIWNAGWSEAAMVGPAPLGPVRTTVLAALQSMTPECLEQAVAGPRLVPIPNGDRTMFLVFGSGDWTWKDVMADLPAPADGAPALAAQASAAPRTP